MLTQKQQIGTIPVLISLVVETMDGLHENGEKDGCWLHNTWRGLSEKRERVLNRRRKARGYNWHIPSRERLVREFVAGISS